MNAIVAKQWPWRNEEDFETESFLSQIFSFKTYKKYITAIFTHVVLELLKKKSAILIQGYADTGNKDRLYL